MVRRGQTQEELPEICLRVGRICSDEIDDLGTAVKFSPVLSKNLFWQRCRKRAPNAPGFVDVSSDVRALMTSPDDRLPASLASGTTGEAILSQMMSEITTTFPRQLEPARDSIVNFCSRRQ
jgi:hypothetical protein